MGAASAVGATGCAYGGLGVAPNGTVYVARNDMFLFGALRKINVRMISQGASALNLTLVVDNADLREAVERLHTEFFTELDLRVFDPSSTVQPV